MEGSVIKIPQTAAALSAEQAAGQARELTGVIGVSVRPTVTHDELLHHPLQQFTEYPTLGREAGIRRPRGIIAATNPTYPYAPAPLLPPPMLRPRGVLALTATGGGIKPTYPFRL